MSQLQINTNNWGNFRLNVLSFSSPIFGSISGAQTKKNKRWYPIKANQPEIQFEVQFFGEKDYETFQKFIRSSQEWSLVTRTPMLHLNWPERNINNWSGIITEFQSGGQRFNPAPRARFTVFLFDSYVSQYNEMSQLASVGADFGKYFSFTARGFAHLMPNPFNLKLPEFMSELQNWREKTYNVAPQTTEQQQR